MPKSLVTAIKTTLVLAVVILIILALLGVLKIFSRDELVEMAKTAFLILGIVAAGSVAIAGITSDWGNDADEED